MQRFAAECPGWSENLLSYRGSRGMVQPSTMASLPMTLSIGKCILDNDTIHYPLVTLINYHLYFFSWIYDYHQQYPTKEIRMRRQWGSIWRNSNNRVRIAGNYSQRWRTNLANSEHELIHVQIYSVIVEHWPIYLII